VFAPLARVVQTTAENKNGTILLFFARGLPYATGMGRKNFSAYGDDDWRAASSSLRQILMNGWPVYADCDLCDLRLKADLERIAQLAGENASLWGAKPRCRRVGCPGRVTFYLDTPGPNRLVAMTTKRR
tara:strand:+ start:1461 stop:1847 length:387 start_codon:yes stop_codon:yes gene_type:complete